MQGSRTFVPIMPEGEWYRAEAEQTEIFAPLVPVERVWVEEYGVAGISIAAGAVTSRLVSLDGPARQIPLPALDASALSGRRVIRLLDGGSEERELRAVTELHTNHQGEVCARVTTELDWYRWGWSGHAPRTLEVLVHRLWVE